MSDNQKQIINLLINWLKELGSTNDINSPSHLGLIEAKIETDGEDLPYNETLYEIMFDILKHIRNIDKAFKLELVIAPISESEATMAEIRRFMTIFDTYVLKKSIEKIENIRTTLKKPEYLEGIFHILNEELDERNS